MIQTVAFSPTVTFEDFIRDKPEDGLYELHNGVIVEVPQPLGKHEQVKGFLINEIVFEYRSRKLPYFLPNQAFVKAPNGESAYLPDILVVNRLHLSHEPLWAKASTVTQGASIHLVIEVVSTNWRLDYFTKFQVYEEIGIQEYWIVDYLGLGPRRLIGNPKQPTILVQELNDAEYKISLFRGDDPICSPTFPGLSLTAQQIFQAGAGTEDGLPPSV